MSGLGFLTCAVLSTGVYHFRWFSIGQSDDADQTVYHVACAIELATEIMVDLFTFFSPPLPYQQLYVLTAPEAAPTCGDIPQEG